MTGSALPCKLGKKAYYKKNMSYSFNIKDIQKKTGLNERFIRRCLEGLKETFSSHISRGENNALLFDESALVLFDQIKQLKEQNLNIPEIRKRLDYQPGKGEKIGSKPDEQTLENLPEKLVKAEENSISHFYERLLEEKEKTHKAEMEAKSYQVQLDTQKAMIDALQSKLLLLTDGRDPEEVKKEIEAKEKRKNEILDRLGEFEGKWFKKKERKELLEELRAM